MSRAGWLHALALVLLLAVLSLFYVQARRADPQQAQEDDRRVDAVITREARLTRDLLLVRAGLLQNYDPLAAGMDDLLDGVAALPVVDRGPEVAAAVARVRREVRALEDRVERFKSHTAVLRNSMHYLMGLEREITRRARGPRALRLAAASGRFLGSLSSAVIRPGPEVLEQAADTLARLEGMVPPPELRALHQAFVEHGRMALARTRDTDLILHALMDRELGRAVAAADAAYAEHWAGRARRAALAWFGVYGVGLLLLVYVAVLLWFRKRTLRRLRETVARLEQRERQLRALVENAGDAVLVHDAAGNLRSVNPQACRLLDYTPAELLAQNIAELVADGGSSVPPWPRPEPELSVTWEGRFRRRDGGTVPVELRSTVFESDGEILYLVLARDLSERQKAELTRERLMALLEAIPDLVALVDTKGCLMHLNTPGRYMLGIDDPAGVPGRPLGEYVASRSGPLGVETMLTRAAERGLWYGETVLLAPEGRRIPALQVVVAHRDAEGRVEYYSTIARDISDRLRAERQLRENEERLARQQAALLELTRQQARLPLPQLFAAVTETAARTLDVERVSVWLLNADNSAIECQDLFEQTPDRHSRGAMLAQADYPGYFAALEAGRVIAAGDAHRDPATREFSGNYLDDCGIGAMLDAPLRIGGQVVGVICHEHVGGSRHWELDEQNFAGSVADFLSMALELDQHRRTAAELKRHREQLELLVAERTREVHEKARIIDQVHDAVITVDTTGRVQSWNMGAQRLLGYAAAEMLGRSPRELLAEESAAANEVIGRALTDGRAHEGEVRLRHKSGRLVDVHLSLSPMQDVQGRPAGTIVYALDVSARRRAEELVRQRSRQLEAVNEELEAFSYSVSHDLRAPLRAIEGFSRAMVEDYGATLDDTARDYLDRINRGAKRMGQLIEDLLMLSRVSRGSLQWGEVDLSALAAEIAETLRAAEPERRVTLDITPGIAARADPNLLRVALQNLLDNAWKYTRIREHAHIEFGVLDEGGQPVFYVRDDGVGFDPRFADKLFRPFQRLHRVDEFEGTGIGLATVHRIVRRHGGRVWAESEPDRGATFYFTLGGEADADASLREAG